MAVETERARREQPRPRRTEPTEEGRRLSTAARALVITALALLLAAFLNAQNIYKSVYNQPEGTQREVALAFAGPLREVSMALRLDRPRAWVESAIGREHAEIDTEIVLPRPPSRTDTTASPGSGPTGEGRGPTGTTPTAPDPPEKPAFTPEDPMRLWIAGDSLVITPGYAVFRAFGHNDAVERVGDVDGRVATGLTRPDVFNWFRHVDEQVRKENVDLVVFCFGGNDDHDYMTGVPNGVSIDDFGDAAWTKEYRRRAGGLMDTANQAGAFVVWLGLPITNDGGQARRWRLINRAVIAEAEKRQGKVAYVDMYGFLSDDDGEYAPYLPSKDGQLEKVRADDGVHLERAGGDIVAKQVVREVRGMVDITSWRNETAG
jgi:uncharacterized protein